MIIIEEMIIDKIITYKMIIKEEILDIDKMIIKEEIIDIDRMIIKEEKDNIIDIKIIIIIDQDIKNN